MKICSNDLEYGVFLKNIFDLFCSSNINQFHSIEIPRLELENSIWNTYVGHWNSYVGISMSNIGISTWVLQVQPRNSEAREPTSEDIQLAIKMNFEL